MAGSPTAYTVHPKSGIKTVAEFVAFAKEKKGAVNYGSAGFATPSHLAGEFFKNRAGLEMTHAARADCKIDWARKMNSRRSRLLYTAQW
jgi:tripartite-type tricarboxylate transporter receptor subunit TctC